MLTLEVGAAKAYTITTGNEAYGLYVIDLSEHRFWRAIGLSFKSMFTDPNLDTGTAFQFKDLHNNAKGIIDAKRYIKYYSK